MPVASPEASCEVQLQCTVSCTDKEVVVKSGGTAIGLNWSQAIELTKVILRVRRVCLRYVGEVKRTGRLAVAVDSESIGQLSVKAAGPALLFELNGRFWFVTNYRQAVPIARAIAQQARKLEEQAKAAQIIADQAILLRTPLGRLVGLSDNSKINREALKAAEDLNFVGMVEPKFVCHTPSIVQGPPKPIPPVKE